MILTDVTMTEFEQAVVKTRVAVLPVGSVEEHGAHLPLGTDTMQVWEVARLAADLVPILVCPPLHYGYCRSTRDHPGTVSISPETLRRLVVDIGASLHAQGVRGLVVISGHAGGLHMAALEEAAERLAEAHADLEVAVACEYHWARECGREGIVETEDDGHAGEIETSRIQAIDPGLVKGSSPEEYPRFPKPFVSRTRRADWPGGVWGDPSRASPEKGRLLLARSADRLAALAEDMERRIRDSERGRSGSTAP